MSSILNLGSIGRSDERKLLQLIVDEIVNLLVCYVSVHPGIVLILAWAEAIRNNPDLLS